MKDRVSKDFGFVFRLAVTKDLYDASLLQDEALENNGYCMLPFDWYRWL